MLNQVPTTVARLGCTYTRGQTDIQTLATLILWNRSCKQPD